MQHNDLLQMIFKEKLIGIFRGVPLNQVAPAAQALEEGGLKFIELTYNQSSTDPNAELKAQMEAVRKAVGNTIHVGVGTVLNTDQAEWARSIGAEYIVSPVTKADVIKKTKEMGLVSIPGANSPTEINLAFESGADLVKLYTIDHVKDVKYLMGPLGHIPMQITCGATLDTISDFKKAGIKCFGTRAFITDALIKAEDYRGMTELTKRFIHSIQNE